MEIFKKIAHLKKTIYSTNDLADKLVSIMEIQQLETINKQRKIEELKQEVQKNIDKIDKIIENYNANT